MNFFIYLFILYYVETYKHGINLLNYIFDPNRISAYKQNADIIENEDSDVKEERSRVQHQENSSSPV